MCTRFWRSFFTAHSFSTNTKSLGLSSSRRMRGLFRNSLISCSAVRETRRGEKSQLWIMRAGMKLLSFQLQ
ncbi:hypothetical protein M5D96_005928 [Drosophila gunungcola]|uniref:Uncharacterized protein n=1 Tax=Drosophila gunungcola TaxID=103775 RepID=A0A9P9YRX2_9MUSC|nr:hypothetical protein M5D96_005928 [Drosophila gunungcola]